MKANADLLLESLRTDALFLQMGGADGNGIEVSENRIYSMVWYEDAEFMFLPMQAINESYELKLKKFFGKGYILTWELHSWGGNIKGYDDFGLAPWFYTVVKGNPADKWVEIGAVFFEFGKTSSPGFFKEFVCSNREVLEDGSVEDDGIGAEKDRDMDALRKLFYDAGPEKIYASFEGNRDLKEYEWYKAKERPGGGLVYKNEFVSLTIVRTGFLETCVIRDFLKRVEASRQSYSSALDDIWRENAVEAKGTPAEKFSAARSKLNAFNARDAVDAPNLFRFIFDNVFPE